MKRYIRASSLTDEFMKYHESYGYNSNIKPGTLDKVYDILDKYGNDTEPVDEVFDRATPEDQQKMLDLLRPTSRDGAHEIYQAAFSGDTKGTDYGQGVIDMFNQLVEDGYIDEREWYR